MNSRHIRSPNPFTPDTHSFACRNSAAHENQTPNTNYMKLTRILSITACAALAFAAMPAFAAEHEKDKKGEPNGAHATKVPDTAEGIVAEIHKHHGEVAETIKAKQLKAVHEHSEAITALAKSLPTKVAADKKARVEGTTKNIGKLADALHEAADGGDQAKTEAQLKKLDAVLAQLDSQVK